VVKSVLQNVAFNITAFHPVANHKPISLRKFITISKIGKKCQIIFAVLEEVGCLVLQQGGYFFSF
jgi:hypothetical protein